MNNKDMISQNNAQLILHRQDILDLPTVAEIAAEASTGQYVWKKYEAIPEIEIVNPQATVKATNSTPVKFFLSDANFDVHKVDITFFAGVTLTINTSSYKISENCTIDGVTTKPIALEYDAEGGYLYETGLGFNGQGNISFTGVKIIPEKCGNLICYAISNNANAYPNDGIQSDFWYERFNNSFLNMILNGWYTVESSDGIKMKIPYEFRHSSAVTLNGEIHILGGGTTGTETKHYKWDGTSWTSASTLPYKFRYAEAVVLNGEIHILGGYDNLSYSPIPTNHYKWDGTSWTSVSTLPYKFNSGSAVTLNGEIHILGSSGGSIYHYKWDGTSWTSVSTLPYSLYNGSSVVLNNEIHILGSSGDIHTKHYKWDGTSWTSVSTLPYDFYDGVAVVLNSEIHILGSTKPGNETKHYKWDGTSWESVSTLPYEFADSGAVILNGEIHILGSNAGETHTDHYTYIA